MINNFGNAGRVVWPIVGNYRARAIHTYHPETKTWHIRYRLDMKVSKSGLYITLDGLFGTPESAFKSVGITLNLQTTGNV